MHDDNSWDEWKNLVLYRLDAIDKRTERIEAELGTLKIRSAKLGGVAGVLSSLLIVILNFIVGRIKP